MVKVIAIVTAKEGQGDALQAELIKAIAPTRAEEGCHHYDLYRDPKTPTRFVFDESWESEAHLMAHSKSDHLLAMREATKDLVESRVIHILEPAH